jgi:hypothetical protein
MNEPLKARLGSARSTPLNVTAAAGIRDKADGGLTAILMTPAG